MRKIAWIGIICILLLVMWASVWRHPGINYDTRLATHQCIHQSADMQSKHINSMGHTFHVYYVPHSSSKCVNPGYPSIHITMEDVDTDMLAWLQIVRTDANVPALREFVDAPIDHKEYPFYPSQQDQGEFYDTPVWNYNILSKPLSFWKAHAYAVQVDHDNMTIQPLGGVRWGFTLSYTALYPQMIVPSALTYQDWSRDWPVFQSELPNYTANGGMRT